jgi:hypothetical protein
MRSMSDQGTTDTTTCDDCGAVVGDVDKHQLWHHNEAERVARQLELLTQQGQF